VQETGTKQACHQLKIELENAPFDDMVAPKQMQNVWL
jgi:hypothetical protein